MKTFSALLDVLYFTHGNNAKATLIKDYLANTPDPERGWAIAAITGELSFRHFKRNLVKQLILERVDPVLFDLSYDYVGETSETVAHLWPTANISTTDTPLPSLTEVVNYLQQANKTDTADYIRDLLDRMTAPQRWTLIKLGTRGLRVGVSARFMKSILADFGTVALADVEQVWHGVTPPYTELMLWLEGKASKPDLRDRLIYHPVMLAHPVDEQLPPSFSPDAWQAEWKYDGIRVQLVSNAHGSALFSRTGEDISASFPDVLESVDFYGVFDGELLVMQHDHIGSFNQLQQRLNKKKPARRLLQTYPAGIMLYDMLKDGQRDLTGLTLQARRQDLETWHQQHGNERFKLSPLLTFADNQDLLALKAHSESDLSQPVEGLMLKHKHSRYQAGRPKGQWYKWKRQPQHIDTVIMYAQRGHGKRSSFYSDFTFGLWHEGELLPVGKAYSGFTDEEMKKLDRWVRSNTIGRFGPVKEVKPGLVFEVAFDAAHPSNRHKSGVALRFPRIKRIRWDKPADQADSLSSLKALVVK